jgi:hypothetical protein
MSYVWDKKSKVQVGVRSGKNIVSVILHPDQLSEDGRYVKVGVYFHDQAHGVVDLESGSVVCCFKVMRGGDSPLPELTKGADAPRVWWRMWARGFE